MNPTLLNRYSRAKTWRGHLFALLAWLNWPKLTARLMGNPWHVASELRYGQWIPVYAFPKNTDPTVDDRAYANAMKDVIREKPQHVPARTHLGKIRMTPGMSLWQMRDGQAVRVAVKGTKGHRYADVDLTSPITVAMNAKNAERKLKSSKRS